MKAPDFSQILLPAPIIFICHFLEESPGFVVWFNSHVNPDITSALFWTVNVSALLITTVVVAVEWISRSAVSLGIAIMWFSFVMLANAVFHIVAAVVDQQYVPGLITAALLYLPYYFWLFTAAVKSGRGSLVMLLGGAFVGALLMSIHGYLILFRGSRLF